MSNETKRDHIKACYRYEKNSEDDTPFIFKISTKEREWKDTREINNKHCDAELFTFRVKLIRRNGKLYCVYVTNEGGRYETKWFVITKDAGMWNKEKLQELIIDEITVGLNLFKNKAETKRLAKKLDINFQYNLFDHYLLDLDEMKEESGIYNKPTDTSNDSTFNKETFMNKLESILNQGSIPYMQFKDMHNISPDAIRNIKFYDDRLEYKCSFNGKAINMSIKYKDILGLYKG